MSETNCASEHQNKSIEEFKATFECVLAVYHLVNDLKWSAELHTSAFYNRYLSDLKEQMSEICNSFAAMKELFTNTFFYDSESLDEERLNKHENWSSFVTKYNDMLNQFYGATSLEDISLQFSVLSLLCPCLLLSLSRYEHLPCELVSIHQSQLHDEAALFKSPGRGASATVDANAAANVSLIGEISE